MLQKIREYIAQNSWIGWVVALAIFALAIWLYFARSGGTSPYNPEHMRQSVTVRFTDTNEETTMTFGQLDKELRRRGDVLDPKVGITNPKTGQPTGFPVADMWNEMVTRINKEKEEIRATSGPNVRAAPREAGQLPPDAAKILQGDGSETPPPSGGK